MSCVRKKQETSLSECMKEEMIQSEGVMEVHCGPGWRGSGLVTAQDES